MTCDLCKRLCIRSHLHGLESDVFHSCGSVFLLLWPAYEPKYWFIREVHPCPKLCSAPGICQIDTAPLSIEDTSTGRHETVQYTKVIINIILAYVAHFLSCPPFCTVFTRFVLNDIYMTWSRPTDTRPVARRLQCIKTIEAGENSHEGAHIHTNDRQPFHFCETRYVSSRQISC